MTTESERTDTLILDTGLFDDRDTLLNAIEDLALAPTDYLKLIPEQMNDGDWDQVVTRLLSARRIITV